MADQFDRDASQDRRVNANGCAESMESWNTNGDLWLNGFRDLPLYVRRKLSQALKRLGLSGQGRAFGADARTSGVCPPRSSSCNRHRGHDGRLWFALRQTESGVWIDQRFTLKNGWYHLRVTSSRFCDDQILSPDHHLSFQPKRQSVQIATRSEPLDPEGHPDFRHKIQE